MREFKDIDGKVHPTGNITTNIVYSHVQKAWDDGYAVLSEQGGTRSGKTINTMVWVCTKACKERIKVGILRKSFPTLRMSILRDFIDVMQQLGLYHERSFHKTEHIYHFPNGSEVHFISADESEKLKGFRGDIIWLNESTEFTYDDFMQLRFRCEKMLILDYNPNFSDSHWIAKHINTAKECDDYTNCISVSLPKSERKGTYFFITTYRDNPFLSKQQVVYIEGLKDSNYTLYVQYALGKRCVLQGRVFPNINLYDDTPKDRGIRWYVGIDYGYGNNPTAIVKVGIAPKALYIEEVAFSSDLRTEQMQEILLTDSRVIGLPIVADSANEIMNEDLENVRATGEWTKKLRITRVNKHGRKSALARIEAVRKMQQYIINIKSDSINVIGEFEQYVFKKEKNSDTYTNDPVNKNDHAIDAVRYVVMEKSNSRNYSGGLKIYN